MKTATVERNGKETDDMPGAAPARARKSTQAGGAQMVELYSVPQLARTVIPIEGLSSFISHRKDSKAGELWEKKMTGKGTKRELVNPEAEWKASLYLHPETKRPCIPGRGVKKAMVSASIYSSDRGLRKRLQGAFFVTEEFIPISYDKEFKRRDFLPLKGGMSHHNSYRVEFFGWKARVPIEYNAHLITPEALFNAMEVAGFSIGIGDDRPEKGGMHGRFRVVVPGRGR